MRTFAYVSSLLREIVRFSYIYDARFNLHVVQDPRTTFEYDTSNLRRFVEIFLEIGGQSEVISVLHRIPYTSRSKLIHLQGISAKKCFQSGSFRIFRWNRQVGQTAWRVYWGDKLDGLNSEYPMTAFSV